MNNEKETWFKWDYVCTNCDSHVEMTIKSNGLPHAEICPNCNTQMTLMSVLDVTIDPTTKKEETNMDTLTPAQTMTLTWIENDVERTETYSESDIRAMYWNNKNLAQKQNEWYKKESQLRTLLEEVIADSSDAEVLEQIADIFDVPLTKEIEATAWIRVDMVIEVDIREGEYDIEDIIRNNLTVDSFGSEISVNDYDVDRVEEGAY
jgi:Zn-finger nucleic acid-binding protein